MATGWIKGEKSTHDDLGLGVGRAHDAHHLGVGGDDVGNVDGEPARVALVVLVPVGRGGLAVLRVAVLRPDVLHLVRKPGRLQLVPHERTPAGDLGDAVAEGHWLC